MAEYLDDGGAMICLFSLLMCGLIGGRRGTLCVHCTYGRLTRVLLVAQVDSSVYSLAWSPDSNQLCFTCGKDIIVKPLQVALGPKPSRTSS